MDTIIKRSRLEEEFCSGKIENSMRNAGISQETARRVADTISYHEGITTSEVRNRVIGGIKNREPQAAKAYESYPKKTHKT
jgi:2-phosphoglycerate kinase